MFYIANKVLTYPCKTVIEDVLSREGVPGEDAFFPISGQYHLIRELLRNNNKDTIDFTVQDIVRSNVKDFVAEKARPNDDGVDREEETSEITDYYTRMEDIDEAFVIKYVSDIVKGYRFKRDGAKSAQIQTFDLWEDEEDGLVSPADVIEEVEDYSLDDVEDAKKKLPYLLKVLFDGSLKYQGSLLSFVIAAKKLEKAGVELRPRFICNADVYRVDSYGNLTTKFVVEDNTGAIFRKLVSWINGEEEDRYYHAAQELIRVCTILGLDLAIEDSTQYTPEVIDSAVCQYIMSNEEYLEEYGYANRNIIDALSPEEVLKVAKQATEDDNDYAAEFVVQTRMDDIAIALNIIRTKRSSWVDKPKAVKKFLQFYKENIDKSCSTRMITYEVDDGVLRNADGVAVPFSMDKVIPGAIALLSTSGYLILYEDFRSDYLRYMSISDFMDYWKRGGRGVWENTSV